MFCRVFGTVVSQDCVKGIPCADEDNYAETEILLDVNQVFEPVSDEGEETFHTAKCVPFKI